MSGHVTWGTWVFFLCVCVSICPSVLTVPVGPPSLTLTKSNLKAERIYFSFRLLLLLIIEGSQERKPIQAKLKQRPQRYAAYWLASLYSSGPPAWGWDYPECTGSSYINQQSRKCPTHVCTLQPARGDSPVEVPLSSQVILVCVKLANTNHHNYCRSLFLFIHSFIFVIGSY